VNHGEERPHNPQNILEDPRRDLVARVLGSRAFQRTPRLRELLLFVTSRALESHGDTLNEREIGCAVFNREANYNANDDNIVRVQARQLRFRLEEYFRAEGAHETLILEIPKGGYAPVFRERIEPADAEKPELPPSGEPWKRRALLATAAAALATSVALLGWFRPASPTGRTAQPQPLLWPLSEVFRPEGETCVVVADSLFVVTQAVTGRTISLEEYLSPGYPAAFLDAELPPRVRTNILTMSKRQFLAFSDLTGVSWLSRMAERNQLRASIRHARQVGLRDLRDRNVIIFGSPTSNPWASLHVPRLNFQIGKESGNSRFFTNRQPASGEPDRFICARQADDSSTDYGLIALIPNLDGRGNVLLIHGSMMEGTEAATLFLSDPANIEKLRTAFLGRPPGHFEALIRVRALSGSARETAVAAVRQWTPR
jgi:hypothetical protein